VGFTDCFTVRFDGVAHTKRHHHARHIARSGAARRVPIGSYALCAVTSKRWDTFEFVFALVAKGEVGTCEEIGDGARDDDLVRVGVGADALSDVHGDASDVVVLEFDLAAVETSADRESERMDLVADRARAADGPGRTVEGGQHTVVILLLVVVHLVTTIRATVRQGSSRRGAGEILAERFARGEIDEDEYRKGRVLRL
jgi:hypothetical protein